MLEEKTHTLAARGGAQTGTLSRYGSRVLFKSAAPHSCSALLIQYRVCDNPQPQREMAETAPAAAAQRSVVIKKKPAAKAKKTGQSVGELIVKAVSASKERSGVSFAALKKALAAGGYDVEKNNSRVKLAIKSLVTKGTLVQTKGTGVSGSFKLNKNQAETKKKPAKKAAPKAKKPAAKKPAAAKKPKTAAAKTVAKKSPKKAKKPAVKKARKSPKKAKKPAAAPKKTAKSPKKAKAAKPKATKSKAAKPKKAAPKKK